MAWSKMLNTVIKPSTRAFFKEASQTTDMSLLDKLHGYIYARFTYLYIGIGTGEHSLTPTLWPIFRRLLKLLRANNSADATNQTSNRITMADTYHGKVVSLESAKKLVTINQEISLTNLEQVIPYARARDIVLHNPDHIVVLNCPCRTSRPNPCTPLDVCLVVGEPFASFVIEHHPNRSRWITQAEAVDILESEHQRGHVHHAFFKDAMLGRFYAICNCCSCCCGAMQAMRHGVPMLAASGFVSRVDEDLCIACGLCQEYCQFEALTVNGMATVDSGRCMGCGVCVSMCDQEALTLVRDASKGEPLEIQRLMEMVEMEGV